MRAAVLAQLMRQEAERGADLVSLRALVEEAGELGATRALKRLGLADDKAAADMAELRDLLGAWRDAKAAARKAVLDWVLRILLALLLAGLAVRLGFQDWLK